MANIGKIFNATAEVRMSQELIEIAAIHLADGRPDLAVRRLKDAALLFSETAKALKRVAQELTTGTRKNDD